MTKKRTQVYVPLIRRFAARVVLFHSTIASRLGLNATDLQALVFLRDKSMTAGALGTQIGLTGPSVTALIDRLEKAGYVVRERELKDRRQVTIHPIRSKLQEIDKQYEEQGARMTKLLSTYSEDDFRVVARFLEQSIEILKYDIENPRERNL